MRSCRKAGVAPKGGVEMPEFGGAAHDHSSTGKSLILLKSIGGSSALGAVRPSGSPECARAAAARAHARAAPAAAAPPWSAATHPRRGRADARWSRRSAASSTRARPRSFKVACARRSSHKVIGGRQSWRSVSAARRRPAREKHLREVPAGRKPRAAADRGDPPRGSARRPNSAARTDARRRVARSVPRSARNLWRTLGRHGDDAADDAPRGSFAPGRDRRHPERAMPISVVTKDLQREPSLQLVERHGGVPGIIVAAISISLKSSRQQMDSAHHRPDQALDMPAIVRRGDRTVD